MPNWLDYPNYLNYIFIFFLGMIIGSFLNVCIYRIPRGESIVFPPSHCPHCQTRLKPWELVPVISWLWLRGRCHYCGEPVSWRYPAVELLTGLIFLLLFARQGLTWSLLGQLVLASFLLVLTMIDLEHCLLPDKLTISGLVVGFAFSALTPGVGWRSALVGLLAAGGSLLLLAVVSRGGMGGGDIKLAAMIGAWLGWPQVILAVFLAFVVGGLAGILLLVTKIKSRKDLIPFGPFLAVGTFIAMLWGQGVVRWYLSLF